MLHWDDFIRMGLVAIYLVGGVVETEGCLTYLVQTVPLNPSRHLVHHDIRLVQGKHPIQFRVVADIHLFKGITFTVCDTGQGFQVTRIGEFIEVDNGVVGIPNDMTNNPRADKTCATSDKNLHSYALEK